VVTEADLATFDTGPVHPVCATFTLAKHIEWASRLFVLAMKDDDEEGIGTMLTIEHRGPALQGQTVTVTATVDSCHGHELICSYTATAGQRLIATGKTGQRILKKTKLKLVMSGEL